VLSSARETLGPHERDLAKPAPPLVSVLGHPRLALGRSTLPLGGQRARLLVALAVAGGTLSVDELADVLWERERPSSWRGALRVLVHDLRRILLGVGLTPAVLQRSGPILLLEPAAAGGEVDLWLARDAAGRARSALESGDPAAARALAGQVEASFAQGILPGVEDDAVIALRARVVRERVRNLELLARSARALGDAATALEAAERGLELDPTNQPLCQEGMAAAEAGGAAARGLVLYARLRSALASELGISPSSAVAASYARLIAANDGGPRSRERAQLPAPLGVRGPVVGRAGELSQLCALWGRVERGEGLAAVVLGAPGIGKTTLLGELASVVSGRGGRVLYGRECDPAGHELAALLEALDCYRADCLRRGGPFELGSLGADLEALLGQQRSIRLKPRSRRLRLSQAVHEWWAALGSRSPTLIVLDDLQWASPTTAGIMADLAVEGLPEGVLVVGAARTARSLLPDSIASMLSWGARRLDLGPLGPEAVGELLGSIDRRAARFATEVWLASGGNPERVRELVVLLDSQESEGSNLRARSVMARLSSSARRAVAALAVLGRAAPAATVLEVAGLGDVAVLEEVRAGGVVEVRDNGTLALAHDLLGEDALRALEADERIRLHARAAEVLSRRGVSSHRLAHHLAQAAPMIPGARLASTRWHAAREAAAVGAYEDALAELDALERDHPGEAVDELDRLVLRLECWSALGDPRLQGVAVEIIELAVARGRIGVAASAAEVVTAALIPTLVGREDPALTARLEQALRRARRPEHIATLASALALSRVWTAPAVERRRLARRALAALVRLDEQAPSPLAIATLTRAHLGSLEAAHPAERLLSARRILELANSVRDTEAVARAHVLVHDALVELGHLDEADLELQAARLCAAALDDQIRWEVAIRDAGRRIMAGRLADAERAAEQALAVPRSASLREGAAAVYGAQLMLIREAQGRLVELADAFLEFRRAQAGWVVWDAAEARIALAAGDTERARELLARGLLALEEPSATDITWLARMLQYAWVATELGDAEAAARLVRPLARLRGTLHWSVCLSLGPVDLLLARLLLLVDASRARSPRERARRQLAHPGLALWRAKLEEFAA
jgi:DNA-binding SARP family transcriptional activator